MKLKSIKKFIGLFFIIFISCEKEIDLKLPEHKQKVVIEAWIENNDYAYVSITRNSPYFSKVDSNTLANLFILDANVYLSDGVITEKLEIDPFSISLDVWPFIKYKSQTIKGEIGRTYTLKIFADGDSIFGTTNIPNPVYMDTVWWAPDTINKPGNDSLGYIWATFTDNIAIDEYIRIFTKRKGRDNSFVPIWGSVYDDIYVQGKTIDFTFYRGISSFSDSESIREDKELFYFKKGDTVEVKVSSMNREHYDFWRTIEQENFSSGNPFIYPVVIRHNVKGGIGVFGGYNSIYYTLIIGENKKIIINKN